MKIKAITLWQPWATLVAIGQKRYETRSWPTNHRGLLAIHAARRKPVAYEIDNRIDQMLISYGMPLASNLPLGAVLCIVELQDVKRTEYIKARARFYPGGWADEIICGDYSPGRFAWKLRMVKRLDEPIPARGFQGLWDWTVPAGIVESLKEAHSEQD